MVRRNRFFSFSAQSRSISTRYSSIRSRVVSVSILPGNWATIADLMSSSRTIASFFALFSFTMSRGAHYTPPPQSLSPSGQYSPPDCGFLNLHLPGASFERFLCPFLHIMPLLLVYLLYYIMKKLVMLSNNLVNSFRGHFSLHCISSAHYQYFKAIL